MRIALRGWRAESLPATLSRSLDSHDSHRARFTTGAIASLCHALYPAQVPGQIPYGSPAILNHQPRFPPLGDCAEAFRVEHFQTLAGHRDDGLLLQTGQDA